MKRLHTLCLSLLLIFSLMLPVYADALAPSTPIDKMGALGGPILIIFVLVVLPLALITGVAALTIFLIKKLVKSIKKKK